MCSSVIPHGGLTNLRLETAGSHDTWKCSLQIRVLAPCQLLFGLSCRSPFSVLPSAELPSLPRLQGPLSGLLTVDSLLTLPRPQNPRPTPLSTPALVLSLSLQAHTTITRSPLEERMQQQQQSLPSSLQRLPPSLHHQRRTTKRHCTINRHHTNRHPNKSSTGVQQDC